MWAEAALVSLYRKGDTTTGEVQFAAITEDISINEGDYPGESIPSTAGGRLWKQGPQEDGEITLTIYPIELDTTTAVGLFQQWNGVSGTAPAVYDTSEPLATDSSWPAGAARVRDEFRVSILWTNDASVTSAAALTSASTDSLRFYATGCRIISHNTTWSPSDGLKIEVTFKYPALNKAGTTKSAIWESGDNTALSALGAYS